MNTSTQPITPCLYDRWLIDPDYRDQLEQSLGFKGDPTALLTTAKYGPGSSFEGFGEAPDAAKLLRRFESFCGDPLFVELSRDEEVLNLNQGLFGDTPGSQWAA